LRTTRLYLGEGEPAGSDFDESSSIEEST